ncbi:MAG: hypothetical protein ACRELB_06465, partial [Polyangiaceae bacterium]
QVACPAAVRSDCTTWLDQVDGEVPSIVVQARDAGGNDLLDVRVLVDGVKVADRLNGLPIEIDPGSHELRFERDGVEPVQKPVVVVAGQKARVVEVQMAPRPTPQGPETSSSFWKTTPAPVLVLGGVAAAALVSTTVFWIWGRSDYASLRSSCSPACSPSSIGGVRAKLVAGDVSLGVAVVALGVGAWLELTRGHADAPAPASAALSRLVVQPQPGGGVVGVGGRF